MSFLHPSLLWLITLPVLLLGWEALRVVTTARRFSGEPEGKILTATAGATAVHLSSASSAANIARRRFHPWLALGLACAAVALARPQWGKIEEPVFDQSREILVAMDLSRSMLAQDVRPSRLERSRLLIQSLLDKLSGERVGLVVFAGTAFLQAPLSSDYEILREFLPALNPGFLPQAGTNYADLLRTALDSYSKGDADRFLIVLSDGEADPADPWKPLAEDCKKRGIQAITLGVGTAEGTMIPDDQGGLVKDERGAAVLSRLEPATLQELANLTGGVYADASQWVDLAALLRDTIEKGSKGEFQEGARVRYAERFQWVLAPALLFFLLSLWREFPVQPKPRRLALAPARAMAFLLLAVILPGVFGGSLHAVVSDPATALLEPPPPSQDETTPPVDTAAAEKLAQLVGKLSTQDTLSSSDTVALAEATLAFGQPLRAQNKPVPTGPVDDALEAVRRAEKNAPAAADWKKLREQLEALKQSTPPQEQSSQDKKDDEKKENESQQDKKTENQQNDSSSDKDQKNDQQQQQSQSQSGQDKQNQQDSSKNDNQQQSGQSDKKDSANDTDTSQQKSSQQNETGQKQDQSNQSAGDTGQQNAPDKAPSKKGEQAFDAMRDDQTDKKQQPTPQPVEEKGTDTSGTQKVGGVPAQGTPLDKNVDPKLLVPLQRLERVKEGDNPGVLFQRMQENQQSEQPKRGRTW